MEYTLRGGPLEKGDKILIHTKIDSSGHYCSFSRDEIVMVEYLIPCFGKIIVKNISDPGLRWNTSVLYYNQEDYVWSRI
jgi:hypothetical protein